MRVRSCECATSAFGQLYLGYLERFTPAALLAIDGRRVARPFAVQLGRPYVLSFGLSILRSGMGVHVVADPTRILRSRYGCGAASSRSTEIEFPLDAGDGGLEIVVLSNCGLEPVVSEYAVTDMRIRAFR